MWILLIFCGFHLQFADSIYNLGIPLTVADSATAQLNYTHVFLFVCGFRIFVRGFRIFAYFCSNFERYSVLGICLWSPKQQKRSKNCNSVADSATNQILAWCGIHIQCTECTVWPCNDRIENTGWFIQDEGYRMQYTSLIRNIDF